MTAYRVSETRVQRVTASRVGQHAIRSRTGQEGDYTLLFVNFDAVEHDLTAEVRSAAGSSDEPILEASHVIDSGEGIERRLERTESTRYDVTVRLDGETRATLENGDPRSVGATSYIIDDEIEIGTFSAIP